MEDEEFLKAAKGTFVTGCPAVRLWQGDRGWTLAQPSGEEAQRCLD